MLTRSHGEVRFADYGSVIQFPSDTKDAAALLDVDWRATNDAVERSALPTSVALYWNNLYAAWRSYADPILDSWSWNPVGAAAFADQNDLVDWRKKLQTQQEVIRQAGVSGVPTTLAREKEAPFTIAGLSGGTLLLGGIVLAAILVVVPRLSAPKR